MEQPKSINIAAIIALGFLCSILLICLAAVSISVYYVVVPLEEMKLPIPVHPVLYYAFRCVLLVSLIGAVISFIFWMSRCFANLHRMGAPRLRSKSWAVWAWLIPLVNFIAPYFIASSMVKATDVLLEQQGLETKAAPTRKYLAFWWFGGLISWLTAHILKATFALLAYRATMKFRDMQASDTFFHLFLVVNLCEAVITTFLVLMTIKLVRDYTKTQNLLISKAKKQRNGCDCPSIA